MSRVEVEMSWAEMDGAGWSLEHGLVIPNFKRKVKTQSILQKVVYEKFYVHEKIFNRAIE